jgi:hypothetical protein
VSETLASQNERPRHSFNHGLHRFLGCSEIANHCNQSQLDSLREAILSPHSEPFHFTGAIYSNPCHLCDQWLGLFGIVWNDGIDSSITTHGNLSSRKIVFCGANGVGSSSDAIVKSIVSESFASSKNK